jgi:hypothetical protein
VWKKAGVTVEESVVKLRLIGNPEKTERLILDWFSISFFLSGESVLVSFLTTAATFAAWRRLIHAGSRLCQFYNLTSPIKFAYTGGFVASRQT